MKEKFLLFGFLVAAAYSIFISHLWSWAVYPVEKTVALGFISFTGVAVFAAEICGLHFLP